MKFLRIVLGIMPWYSIELDIYVFHFIIAIQNEDLISLNLITIRQSHWVVGIIDVNIRGKFTLIYIL